MREVLIITEAEKVKVLSEETRFRILQLLRERPMTINELSKILKKDRTTIYRHIKMLESVGLVEELESQGNERVYARSARIFLIKADPDDSTDEFRQAYLQVEVRKLVEILEKAGFRIKDKNALKKLIKEVLNEIELKSQPILKRISQAEIELTEIELFHLLNILVFLQSCELCEKAKEAKKLVEF
ncbi:MAG TPA: ArsR family transcriptional regulator [Thermococcus sp.]|nr:ArsR family transcriptional regulator [Thermococcus sp.]